ncbi:MAG: hypothetical protein ACE5JM_09305 [Armatimonadota bacterium]
MTAERFLEIIGRLEWEVLGEQRCWGPRHVIVKIGEPIDLSEHWGTYTQDKRNTVAAVTMQLEDSVRLMLASVMDRANPLVPAAARDTP